MRLAAPALALALLAPTRAWAGNEEHVRTPVLWPAPVCGLVVERGVEPVVQLAYAIPHEDTQLSADELPDSRRHQFFALCRQRPMTELLPNWIALDDVARAEQAGLVEPGAVHPREILDEASLWTDCFVRITPDAERRPITFAAAEQGVTWDTSDAALGVWQIAGYTFEPALNLWSPRPGFVKLVDDREDPEQDLPAAAIVAGEAIITAGRPALLEACVDLLEPGRAIVEWARFAPSLEWQPLAEHAIAGDGSLAFEFTAPEAAIGEEILVRVRVVDALEREFIAHAPARFAVEACADDDCFGGTGDDAVTSTGTCACTLGPTTYDRLLAWSLVLLLLGSKLHTGRRRERGMAT